MASISPSSHDHQILSTLQASTTGTRVGLNLLNSEVDALESDDHSTKRYFTILKSFLLAAAKKNKKKEIIRFRRWKRQGEMDDYRPSNKPFVQESILLRLPIANIELTPNVKTFDPRDSLGIIQCNIQKDETTTAPTDSAAPKEHEDTVRERV